METKVRLKEKEEAIELAAPDVRMENRFKEFRNKKLLPLAKLSARARASPESLTDEERQHVMAVNDELDALYDAAILELVRKGPLKKTEDFLDLAAADRRTLHEWLGKELGMTADKSREGFTKT